MGKQTVKKKKSALQNQTKQLDAGRSEKEKDAVVANWKLRYKSEFAKQIADKKKRDSQLSVSIAIIRRD